LAPSTTYTYQVRATGPLGDSANSSAASASTVPIAPLVPSGLTAVTTSPSAIALSWVDNSANETGFKIERKAGSGAFSFIGQVSADTTAFPDAGLNSDTFYTYRVRATNSAGDSTNSAEAGTATPPTTPSALSAVAFGPGQIKLTWSDTSSSETGFKLERKTGGNFVPLAVVSAGAITYTDTGLVPHSTYLYRVRSTNGGGDSAPSNESSGLTLPAAPSQLAVAAISASQLELTWTDNNPSPPAVKIERSVDGSNFSMVGTSAVGSTTFRDSGLTATATYHYRVRATNAAGDSGYSGSASASTLPTPPAAPSGLTAVAQGSAAVLLTWQDNGSNESGFEISRQAPGGGGFQLVTRTGSNAVTFTDTGVSGSTTYSYRVRAVNAGGTSSYTVPVIVTTPADLPTPPNNLAATAVSSTQIRLTWSDLTTAETGYQVERKPAGGTYQVLTTTNANAVEYLDSGLAEGAAYTYRVTAIGTSGNSPVSGEANAVTLLGAPTALVATAAANRINLAWQDGSTHETGYQIERKTAGGEFAILASVGANVAVYADSAVTLNSTYTYRVKATGSAGSAYSNESSAAPLNVTPLAKLTVAPTKINFGTVRVNANKQKTVKLTNKGKETLTATVGVVNAPFTVVSGGGTFTLAPKQSRTVALRYAPTAAGVGTAVLKITSTVPATPLVNVSLTGKGK
jgi:fibronectin type 3 domain-containing protein